MARVESLLRAVTCMGFVLTMNFAIGVCFRLNSGYCALVGIPRHVASTGFQRRAVQTSERSDSRNGFNQLVVSRWSMDFRLVEHRRYSGWASCCYEGQRGPSRRHTARTIKRFMSNRMEDHDDSETSTAATRLRLSAATEEDMEEIAYVVSSVATDSTPLVLPTNQTAKHPSSGLVIFLQGDLGAGKTTFARSFLRAATSDWSLRVTSPTYLLSNTYLSSSDANGWPTIEIHHMDLYRLSGTRPHEVEPLNLNHVFANCLSLVEWPNRLPDYLVPTERLEITIALPPVGSLDDNALDRDIQPRSVTLTPFGEAWEARVRALIDDGYLDDLMTDEAELG